MSIPDRAFSSQRRLQELRLGGNKISQLTDRSLAGLTRLKSLDLKQNFLEILDNRVFKPMKKLQELNLENNRISEIRSRAFVGCTELRILNLNANLLASVPTEALSLLSHLTELHMARNSLTVITDNSFPLLPALAILDLEGNIIEKIQAKGFSEVSGVRLLNLEDNALYQVPTTALQSFQRLEELKLGQNQFTVIQAGSFRGLNKLRGLDISGCPELVEVAENALEGCNDLETVKISSNRKLDFLHPGSLGGSLTRLQSLDLSSNALTRLSPSLAPWLSLTSVHISGNPLTCDCENSFLKDVIINSVNKSNRPHKVVRCWNPSNLRDRDLAYLELDCKVIHSPNTDPSVLASDGFEVMAAIISVVAVTLLLLTVALIVVSRKQMKGCLSSLQQNKDGTPVSHRQILQYPDGQEPQYISHYQTLPGNKTLNGQGSPVIRVNPMTGQTMLRHDQYFLTLARQQDALKLYEDSNYAIDPATERIYQLQPQEMIYQAVSDTQSDPLSDI